MVARRVGLAGTGAEWVVRKDRIVVGIHSNGVGTWGGRHMEALPVL